jgi:hypothetical protein
MVRKKWKCNSNIAFVFNIKIILNWHAWWYIFQTFVSGMKPLIFELTCKIKHVIVLLWNFTKKDILNKIEIKFIVWGNDKKNIVQCFLNINKKVNNKFVHG